MLWYTNQNLIATSPPVCLRPCNVPVSYYRACAKLSETSCIKNAIMETIYNQYVVIRVTCTYGIFYSNYNPNSPFCEWNLHFRFSLSEVSVPAVPPTAEITLKMEFIISSGGKFSETIIRRWAGIKTHRKKEKNLPTYTWLRPEVKNKNRNLSFVISHYWNQVLSLLIYDNLFLRWWELSQLQWIAGSYTSPCELNFWPRIVKRKICRITFFILETKKKKKKGDF